MNKSYYRNRKPLTRWWWFSCLIEKKEIDRQLKWLKDNNFGGAEISFIYPIEGKETGFKWLSSEWSDLVLYTKNTAEQLDLHLDFTLGTVWPFGGSIVSKKDASKTFSGLSEQRLTRAWDIRENAAGYILNHMDKSALRRYFNKIYSALKPALEAGSKSALFCDSWEVITDNLWTDRFDESFKSMFGYDLEPFKTNIDSYEDVRYDYRKLLAKYILNEFFIPFTEYCNKVDSYSRVQCHGAPIDLIAGYVEVDVPETEAILFDPHFSSFAASAAAISGSNIVSSETFTCIYGWLPHPAKAPYIKQEQTADLKLLADAMFANGTNLIFWHGMPYNPNGEHNEFYATVHVGPDSGFADELHGFNKYMSEVSEIMSRGKTYSNIAVYLPLEDNWMKNRLPKNLERPSAFYHWELQHQKFPKNLNGYHPLWISMELLKETKITSGKLICRNAEYNELYIDVEWLDEDSLDEILRLASSGLKICLKKAPKKPGHIQTKSYKQKLNKLSKMKNVKGSICAKPIIKGKDLPEFWIRHTDNEAYIFFAHPRSKSLKYPMIYGQSYSEQTIKQKVQINLFESVFDIELIFKPYHSVCLKITNTGDIENLTFSFMPKIPKKNPKD
ncbi:MAG: hypothetical protein GY756_26020 [bacterium]|nr:hypothetical protein [bacterium]